MRIDSKFPRILIVGESFDRHTGGGITLRNLFAGWPLDKIAVAAGKKEFTDWESCIRYYRLGRDETKGIWPIYKPSQAMVSGSVQQGSTRYGQVLSSSDTTRSKYRSAVRKKFSALLAPLGLGEWMIDTCVSKEFLKWMHEFSPDVIYTQLGSLNIIHVIRGILAEVNRPLVIHIMDDWAKYLYENYIGRSLLRQRLNHEFRAILQCASARLGICQSMCDAYSIRYGGDWMPFHNPVDLTSWKKTARTQWKAGSVFRILYGGRVGRGIMQSLLDIGYAVSALAKDGNKIVLDIYTPDQQSPIIQQLCKHISVRVFPPLPYVDVPANLAHADLLVIPYDFDKYSALCSRISMPTKTAEYMASGTPVIVYAPGDFAISQYATNEQWGLAVTVPGVSALKAVILSLMKDAGMRERFGRQAMFVAEHNHSAEIIKENFLKTIIKASGSFTCI